MRDRCVSVIRKGSCGLLVAAILTVGAGRAFAGGTLGVPFTSKVCGKWVVRLEDDRKRKVKSFENLLAPANRNPANNEVGFTLFTQPNNQAIFITTFPNTNGTLGSRFIFGSYKKRGKKLKLFTNPLGVVPPGDAPLSQQFARMASLATHGNLGVANAMVDRSKKYKFKGRFTKGKLKLKMKATMAYELTFPREPTRPNRTGQQGRIKFRGKSKDCASEQF